MIIKKFIARNMNEAMAKIKQDLGQDALILSQRKIRQSGIRGIFLKKVFEVTACVDNGGEEENSTEAIENLKKAMAIAKYNMENNKAKEELGSRETNRGYASKEPVGDLDNKKVLYEVKEMKSLIASLSKDIGKEKNNDNKLKEDLLSYMEELDISKDLYNNFFTTSMELEEGKITLKQGLNKLIDIKNENKSGVLVLVGPTGVGKTTTIAKLAGKLSLIDKKKVGLITIDTYRIGAVDQLKTYADIINIPFKVVMNPKEISEALNSMKDCDVILVDTTGRSSKNLMQISELRSFIDKIESKEVSLVISSTTKNRDVDTILRGYENLNYSSVIVTKLDETSSYGALVNITYKGRKPISYITTGQSVPDDIRVPNKEEIIKLILGEESIC
ncbi:flagellar biosynthesis protein FlhF [Clostridium hydrogeniformans]|uniref:flagellar biosynthesis protein FlhF n=1 Tax=Clostridium hydrogeniformans TaxID=349933 RepID=UPI0004882513|nr:flagellar biosynthesis protein FlhF [Clostridium hydrogeniformans]